MKQDIVWKETEEYRRSLAEAQQLKAQRHRRKRRWTAAGIFAFLLFTGFLGIRLHEARLTDELETRVLSGLDWEIPLSADLGSDIFQGRGAKYGRKMVVEQGKKENRKWYEFIQPAQPLYGVETLSGGTVIPAEYDEIDVYPEEKYFIASVWTPEGEHQYQYFNWEGNPLLKSPVLYGSAFEGNYATIQKAKGLWSVIDGSGAELLEVKCNSLDCIDGEKGWFTVSKNFGESHEGKSVYYDETKCGLIDATGKTLLPMEYGWIDSAGEGFLQVQEYHLSTYLYLNEDFENAFGRKFESVGSFCEGLACVQEPDRYGFFTYIDTKGRAMLTVEADHAGDFHQGLAVLVKDKKLRCVDGNGKVVLADCGGVRGYNTNLGRGTGFFYLTQNFSEGLLVYKDEKGKYGYVDQRGKTVVEPIFNWAEDFENGTAEVTLYGKKGLLQNPLK